MAEKSAAPYWSSWGEKKNILKQKQSCSGFLVYLGNTTETEFKDVFYQDNKMNQYFNLAFQFCMLPH